MIVCVKNKKEQHIRLGRHFVGAVGLAFGVSGAALAQDRGELRLGTSYKLMTLDPHYAKLNKNTSPPTLTPVRFGSPA